MVIKQYFNAICLGLLLWALPAPAFASCMDDTLSQAFAARQGRFTPKDQEAVLSTVAAFLNIAEARKLEELHRLHARTLEHMLERAQARNAEPQVIENMQARHDYAKSGLAHVQNRLSTVTATYEKLTGTPADIRCAIPPLPAGIETVIDEHANLPLWREFMAAKYARTLLMQATDQSRHALDKIEVEYAAGRYTALEALDAEQELTEARLNLTHAEKAAVLQAYRLLAATGKLTPEYLKVNSARADVK